AMFLAALGVAWLVAPSMLDEHRWRGPLLLLAMTAAALLANLAFSGALAPGAPRTPIRIVPFRVPAGSSGGPASAPLHSIAVDLLPTGLFVLGVAALALRRRRSAIGPTVFLVALLLIGATLLTRVEVNHNTIDSHRFVTAALLLAPTVAIATFASAGARLGVA